ncbi:hypothetical protein JZ751_013366 [Albula glossodonta]|uniref:Uncharacterized protein n=1 Tax=Albula glossodonta TaxID=121402 RepID=A0A8T2MZK2_9TELE|nr:hypothetical protein JZ751_013366 [Albula glossodonta]
MQDREERVCGWIMAKDDEMWKEKEEWQRQMRALEERMKARRQREKEGLIRWKMKEVEKVKTEMERGISLERSLWDWQREDMEKEKEKMEQEAEMRNREMEEERRKMEEERRKTEEEHLRIGEQWEVMSRAKVKIQEEKDKMEMKKKEMWVESKRMEQEKERMELVKEMMESERERMRLEMEVIESEKEKIKCEKEMLAADKERMMLKEDMLAGEKERMERDRMLMEVERDRDREMFERERQRLEKVVFEKERREVEKEVDVGMMELDRKKASMDSQQIPKMKVKRPLLAALFGRCLKEEEEERMCLIDVDGEEAGHTKPRRHLLWQGFPGPFLKSLPFFIKGLWVSPRAALKMQISDAAAVAVPMPVLMQAECNRAPAWPPQPLALHSSTSTATDRVQTNAARHSPSRE